VIFLRSAQPQLGASIVAIATAKPKSTPYSPENYRALKERYTFQSHQTYSPITLAIHWGITPTTVRKLIANGLLEAFQIPGVRGLKISAAAVERFEKMQNAKKLVRKRREQKPVDYIEKY
jgi:hypothetical protein